MLVVPRYKIPCSPSFLHMDFNSWIGEGICFPVANQNSLSATQKSSSLCVAIACVDVTIKLSWIVKSVLWLVKNSATGLSISFLWVGVSPKQMSLNDGADISLMSSKFSIGVSMSKSLGSGISSIGCCGSGIDSVGAGILFFAG